MPNTFQPSIVAQTLGLNRRRDMITTRGNPATVVDPRSVSDERNEIFKTAAQQKAAPFIERARAQSFERRGYQVMPGGRISESGARVESVPIFPRQSSLGHDAMVNPTTGRHL